MKRIMIVDDSHAAGLLVQHLLSRLPGVEVTRHHDPIEALAECSTHPVSLAVLDYRMPEVDGVTLLGALRLMPDQDQLPAIFVTGEPEALPAVRGAGVAAVLEKPLRPAAILEEVRRVLALDSAAASGHHQGSPHPC